VGEEKKRTGKSPRKRLRGRTIAASIVDSKLTDLHSEGGKNKKRGEKEGKGGRRISNTQNKKEEKKDESKRSLGGGDMVEGGDLGE